MGEELSTLLYASVLLVILNLIGAPIVQLNGVYASTNTDDSKISSKGSNSDQDFQTFKILIGKKSYPIKYLIQGGELKNITVLDGDTINIYLNTTSKGKITVQVPKSLADKDISNLFSTLQKITGQKSDFQSFRTYTFDFPSGTDSMKVDGIVHFPGILLKNIRSTISEQKKYAVLPVSEAINQTTTRINNITLFDIPQILLFNNPSLDKQYNLTLRAMINDGNVTFKNNYEKAGAAVDDWNPFFILQFPSQDFKLGLLRINNLAIGHIKLYDDPVQMLKNVQYWKSIPLNEGVVLKLDDRGTNVIIVEAQFSNGVSGVYAGGLVVQTSQSKSEASKSFNSDRPDDRKLVIRESQIPLDFATNNKAFWTASEKVFCDALRSSGFHVCNG